MPLENLTPATRIEAYLAKIAGEDIITPEVKTRLEYYLNEIAQNGGGGGAGLPAVTEADDGKVLGVVSGEWDKMLLDLGYTINHTYNTVLNETNYTTISHTGYDYAAIEMDGTDDIRIEPGKTYRVTYDDVEYIIEAEKHGAYGRLGAPTSNNEFDWTDYQFAIMDNGRFLALYTPGPGIHSIEIEEVEKELVLGPEFEEKIGYEVHDTDYTIVDETNVTTSQVPGYDFAIESIADTTGVNLEVGKTYIVVLNDVEYTLECTEDLYGKGQLGETADNRPDFTNYPFLINQPINIGNVGLDLITPEAGTYTVEIKEVYKEANVTDDFEFAVNDVVDHGYYDGSAINSVFGEQTVVTTLNDDVIIGAITDPQRDELVEGEEYIVTFEDAQYSLICHKLSDGILGLGDIDEEGPSFVDYPFAILAGISTVLFTEEEGSYSIEITHVDKMAITNSTFDLARGYGIEDVVVIDTITLPISSNGGSASIVANEPLIDGATYILTINGEEYVRTAFIAEEGLWVCTMPGDPFADCSVGEQDGIGNSNPETLAFRAQVAGEYTIKLIRKNANVTDEFEAAVKSIDPVNPVIYLSIAPSRGYKTSSSNHPGAYTFTEIANMLTSGKSVFLYAPFDNSIITKLGLQDEVDSLTCFDIAVPIFSYAGIKARFTYGGHKDGAAAGIYNVEAQLDFSTDAWTYTLIYPVQTE